MEKVLLELQKISKLLETQNLLRKEVLSLTEASAYLGMSESYLYKLTSASSIPFYKPNGKMVYFRRLELEQYLLRNRSTTTVEIQAEVDSLIKKPKS
ncbi:MAG TPA: helix-turn-helix domain-containing protein [Ferruginibacter sp.]|nr:helix-turn-helix domain-containing protein [Ferruginibacter sp.]